MELESFGVRHYIMSPQCLAELETFGGYFQRGWKGLKDSQKELFFKSGFRKCFFSVELCRSTE